MTRAWTFTLVDPTKIYNLWNDLIFPLISDFTMANSPFTPRMVCDLLIYYPVVGPNSANNAGNNVSVLAAIGTGERKNLISDGEFRETQTRNIVDLGCFRLQGSAANVQVDVSIVAN